MAEEQRLFDEFGRRIPLAGLKSKVWDEAWHDQPERRYVCVQPGIDHGSIYSRINRYLPGFGMTQAEFERRDNALMESLAADSAVNNILRGVSVPFFLSRQTDVRDLGYELDNFYLPAAEASFNQAYLEQGYSFVNHCADKPLSYKFCITEGSRHEQLWAARKKGTVVGRYFPCLTEYSIPACLEQMSGLPEQFLLAGGADTSAALIGSPGLLINEGGYPPKLWLAALQTGSPNMGYLYEAYGYDLTFNRRPHLNQASPQWAGGLVVLG